MAYLVSSSILLSHRLALSTSRGTTNSLVSNTFNQGTRLLQPYPLCRPCFSSSTKSVKALCMSGKVELIGNKKALDSSPPSSKEEAVEQVKECLSFVLEKPLKNFESSKQKKKLRQVRLRVEIPIMDESPAALASLLADILGVFSVKKRVQPTKIALFWANPTMVELGSKAFQQYDHAKSLDLSDPKIIELAFADDWDVLFFAGSSFSQWPTIESLVKKAAPCPVVLFNPSWSEDEEIDASGFLSSFETVYSFTALAIQGFFSKTEGAVFRCVKGGGPTKSYPWHIFVKERGEYTRVSSFRKRPDASELENVLYNSIALNSPVTKSIKFLRGLISGASRKK